MIERQKHTKGKTDKCWEEHTFLLEQQPALAVLQPQTVPVLVTGAGAAAIGSLISDIDVGTSQAHRDADKIITATGWLSRQLTFLRSITESWNLPAVLQATAIFCVSLPERRRFSCSVPTENSSRTGLSCTHLRRWHCLRHAWTLSIRMPPPILPLVFYPTWCSMF